MKIYLNLILIVLLGTTPVFAQKSQILTSGLLSLKNGTKEISILNLDKTPYLTILKGNVESCKITYNGVSENSKLIVNSIKRYYPYYAEEWSKYKSPLPKIAARAIYPDYDIYVFDAEKIIDGYYKIFVNGKWKLIKANSSTTYDTWSGFLNKAYVKGEGAIYKQKDSKSGLVKSPKNNSYKIIGVDDDWVKVECAKECEGCENEKVTQGWIRWRMGKTILIDLYYSC